MRTEIEKNGSKCNLHGYSGVTCHPHVTMSVSWNVANRYVGVLYLLIYHAPVLNIRRRFENGDLFAVCIQGIRYQNGHTCSSSCIVFFTRRPSSKRAYTFGILHFALYEASVTKTGIQVRHLVSWFIQGIRYQNGRTRSASCIVLIHCTRYHIRGHTGRRAVLFRRHETRVQEMRAEGYR